MQLLLLCLPLLACVGTEAKIPKIPHPKPEHFKPAEDGKHFEGDIVREKGPDGKDRNALIDKNRLWPKKNGIAKVPYHFSSSMNQKARDAVHEAAKDYAYWTCIELVEIKSTSGQPHYVEVIPGQGCYSLVGYSTWGSNKARQELSLGRNCEWPGTATHEFMHALGFYHEQSRPDRDQYLNVYWNNIEPSQKHNYNKCPTTECTTQNLPYDPNSIMHYGKDFFALPGKIAMEAKNGAPIGQRVGMDKLDIAKINKLYSCGGKTVKRRPSGTPYPDKKPTDKYSNCADLIGQCNNPASTIKKDCAKSCAKVDPNGGYDAYSNCKQLTKYCKSSSDIKTKCSKSCKEAGY